MNRILPLSVVVLVLRVGLFAQALEPANPQTNAKARVILVLWEDTACFV